MGGNGKNFQFSEKSGYTGSLMQLKLMFIVTASTI